MIVYLLKGVLIGLLFGLPVGAVGTMTVQRTWRFGFRSGLLTGLGSSVADCFYAAVGAFGLTLLSDFLLRYQTVLHLLGGGLILYMGVRLIASKENTAAAEIKAVAGAKLVASSFIIGMTNPAALLTFLFAFSYFGISGIAGSFNRLCLVGGVFIGTYIWWTVLSAATYILRNKAKRHSLQRANRVFGVILSAFGTVVLVRTFVPG